MKTHRKVLMGGDQPIISKRGKIGDRGRQGGFRIKYNSNGWWNPNPGRSAGGSERNNIKSSRGGVVAIRTLLESRCCRKGSQRERKGWLFWGEGSIRCQVANPPSLSALQKKPAAGGKGKEAASARGDFKKPALRKKFTEQGLHQEGSASFPQEVGTGCSNVSGKERWP